MDNIKDNEIVEPVTVSAESEAPAKKPAAKPATSKKSSAKRSDGAAKKPSAKKAPTDEAPVGQSASNEAEKEASVEQPAATEPSEEKPAAKKKSTGKKRAPAAKKAELSTGEEQNGVQDAQNAPVAADSAPDEQVTAAEKEADTVEPAPRNDASESTAAVVAAPVAAAAETAVGTESGEAAGQETGDEEESLADKVRVISPARLVLKRFFRSKLSVVGFVLFVSLFIFSFLGPLFVPWGETEVDNHGGEPTYTIVEIRYKDVEGNDNSVYVVEEHISNYNTHAKAFTFSHEENPRLHLLGTDESGRDIFVRLMYGGRLSLTLSFLVVLVYTAIGVLLGGLAGFFGSWVDTVIMRIVDVLNCIPSLPILLIIGAILDGFEVDQAMRIYYLMLALTLLSWTGVARIVRGQILYLREQDYIVATEALGFSPMRKIFMHLVPNVMPQLIVSMTLGLGSVILTEASLSFLGLGVPLSMASWGQMVQRATSNLEILTYHANDWLPAGLMIIIAVVAFNFIGDGLRDALDPKMKR